MREAFPGMHSMGNERIRRETVETTALIQGAGARANHLGKRCNEQG